MAQDLTGLNSLRQALTPYEDVKFELNLNRHPKAHKNKSIIYAENMKLSKDGAVLENEENIENNELISQVLEYNYQDYEIINIIPCNTEFVLFVKGDNNPNFDIWRYREESVKYDEQIALFYDKGIKYNGGKFSGTFTYTSNDSLIIAFCEYDSQDNSVMNPMMTINLGTFTKGELIQDVTWQSEIGEFNDRDLEPYKLPICPEISLPQIASVSNIKGNSYIGTYYVYIRYKINKYDYTQWFNIGYPIINEFKQDTIIHQKVTTNYKNKSDNDEKDLIGTNRTLSKTKLNTYINQNIDLINNCLSIKIKHNDILYNYCQIGFVCIAKTYTKYYITSDIALNKNIEVSTNINNLTEEVFNTNIYENYYNVKNIINKNNKLYISNYKTFNSSKNINVDNINLTLYKGLTIKNESNKIEDNIVVNNISFKKEIVLFEEYLSQSYPKNKNTIHKQTVKFISFIYYCKICGLENLIQEGNYEFYDFENSGVVAYIKAEDIHIGIKQMFVDKSITSDGVDDNLFGVWFWNFGDRYSSRANYEYDYDGEYSNFRRKDFYIKTPNGEVIDNYKLSMMETTNINIEDYYSNKIYYKNNLDNKINNNIITGLCQGEVYDFYIHFIDKYGYITDGYRLENKNVLTAEIKSGEKKEVCFVKHGGATYIINAQDNIFIKDENDNYIINLNIDNIKVLDNYIIEPEDYDITGNIDNTINPSIYIESIKELLEELLKLPEYYLNNLVFGDIFDYQPESITDDIYFLNYFNSQNEEFFKVPKLASSEGDIQLGLKVEIGDITDYGDYVSYFISHKKLEKTYVLNGFGTKNQLTNILLNDKFETGNIVKLYNINSVYDYDGINSITWTLQTNVLYNNDFKCYTNLLNKLAYAQDSQYNRSDRNTVLYLSDSIKEFANTITDNNEIDYVSYIEILNFDKNKYTNNKILYRLGNIEYTNCIINEGLNGIYDKHLALRYGNELNGVVNILSDTGIGSYGDVRLFEIFGFFDFDNLGIYLSEKPKSHKIFINDEDLGTDTFYEVITTLNLFNYKISNIYDTWINFYNVFDEDNDYLKEFNRTIYRSAVISDEGRTNNWRWFENDAYKNIEENKGNITNLLAIGNYLYVHTEHSLFAFSEDNTLSMNNQNLQVATPDIFNTEYKEVFITKLGYGGLQDKDAWVAGQFGYIWFDSDSKKIFKVYGNSMDIVSNDIQEWLENAKIYSVKFANDIKNNRILIGFNIWNSDTDDKNIIISYNILSKTFISFHTYYWENSYNTKNNLYYLYNNNITQYNEDNYGMNIDNEKHYSVSFIINPYYREIKYLEHIAFKLRQRRIRNINDSYNIIRDCSQFPVEKDLLPFQPKYIRVYNDLVDTDTIVCDSIDEDTGMPKNNVENYNTPYWDLGNWNFSFLRDVEHYPESEYSDNYCGRLFGNYFVIAFDFGCIDTLIEFENLDVQLTQDKQL